MWYEWDISLGYGVRKNWALVHSQVHYSTPLSFSFLMYKWTEEPQSHKLLWNSLWNNVWYAPGPVPEHSIHCSHRYSHHHHYHHCYHHGLTRGTSLQQQLNWTPWSMFGPMCYILRSMRYCRRIFAKIKHQCRKATFLNIFLVNYL